MSGSVRGLEFTAELKEAMSGVRDEQVKLNAEAYKDAQKAAADYGSKLAGFRRGTVTADELRESAQQQSEQKFTYHGEVTGFRQLMIQPASLRNWI